VTKKIDAKGLPCPQPVVLAKNALDEIEEGIVDIIIDNESASENVARLARNSGYGVRIREEDGDLIVRIEKKKARKNKPLSPQRKNNVSAQSHKSTKKEKESITVFVKSDTMGKGNDKLGKILMRAFFLTLLEAKPRPDKLIFVNTGVKLTVDGSKVVDSLKKIQKKGIDLLVCGTCLDFFNVKDKIKVGRISNMLEIVDSLVNADKIITT